MSKFDYVIFYVFENENAALSSYKRTFETEDKFYYNAYFKKHFFLNKINFFNQSIRTFNR